VIFACYIIAFKDEFVDLELFKLLAFSCQPLAAALQQKRNLPTSCSSCVLKKIARLLNEIKEDPTEGPGRVELMMEGFSGKFSR